MSCRSFYRRHAVVCVVAAALIGGCSQRSRDCEADPHAAQASQSVRSSANPVENSNAPEPAAADPLAQARTAFTAQRFDSALRHAHAHLVTDANNSEALFLAAECLIGLGRQQEGFETLALIPVDDEQFGLQAAGRVADWHLGSGRPDQATEAFERLIETHGELPLALSRLALLANAQGQRFKASGYLKKLAQMRNITPLELGALVMISEACAVQVVRGTRGTSEKPVEGDLRLARKYLAAGDWRRCRMLAERLRRAFPESTPIAAFLGTVYADQQSIEALQQWHTALPEGIEGQPEYWTTMATWMELGDRIQAAIRCCCESLRRDPTNALLYDKFAQLLKLSGDESASRQASQRYRWLSKILEAYGRTVEPGVTAADYVQISEHLLKLRRPWEAVGWREVAGRTDPGSVKKLDLAIKAYFKDRPNADDRWLLCGVDRSGYVLPDVSSVRVAVSQPSAASAFEIRLFNVADRAGLEFQYHNGNDSTDGSYFLHEMMGGGIGVIDFDRDGYPDLYFSQGGGSALARNSKPNELHRNLSGHRFQQVTTESLSGDPGYGQGVAVADFNQDGFSDLIVANIGSNVLLRNNGDGTFTQMEISAWSERDYWTSLIAVGDLDGDALPDLVECNYIDDPSALAQRCAATADSCGPVNYLPAPDRILRLSAEGDFVSWPEASALEQSPNYSLGAIITNFDDRAGNDLFIANDTRSNAFWISRESEQGRTLSDEARIRGCAGGPRGSLLGCMGIATGDFDHNGLIDLFVTNFYAEPVNLYLQRRGGLFLDKAGVFGLRDPSLAMVGFGAQACDFDRDGALDIAVLNGHAIDSRHKEEPLEMLPQLFQGRAGAFELRSLDDPFWRTRTIGRALVLLDWNRDGLPDAVAGHVDAPATLLENDSAAGDWIRLELVGTTSERDAVGAKVTAIEGDRTFVSWITGGDGYHCTNESGVGFGLGRCEKLDELIVQWPSGKRQQFESLRTDTRYSIVEGDQQPFAIK